MKITTTLILCCLLAVSAYAQDERARNGRIEVSGAIQWERMELSAAVKLNLTAAGIRMPTGRSQAEELIRVEYASLMRPYILAIPVDSSTILADLIDRGELSFLEPEAIAASARRIPPALSRDLVFLQESYTIDLSAISAQLMRHNRPREMRRILTPTPAASYSGIVIIANEELPIHGRYTRAFVEPCLFPKVWDTEMDLIYERNVLDPELTRKTLVHYAPEAAIFQATPSGLTPELAAVVGDNPLRIIARGVFGIRPTDLIIDKDDALVILSSEVNRQLLREGKVAIVLSDRVLRDELDPATVQTDGRPVSIQTPPAP
ncbi:hypothetical protein FACS1894130_06630 [Spirochaetia bacterium]|nr:hypothetical protein FACS1894130_06630 [Spirochaetia bacterium]